MILPSERGSEILNRGIFCDASTCDCLWVTASRPYGTVRLSNLNPGLRPGLSSAVPAGLILPSVGSRAHTKHQSGDSQKAPAFRLYGHVVSISLSVSELRTPDNSVRDKRWSHSTILRVLLAERLMEVVFFDANLSPVCNRCKDHPKQCVQPARDYRGPHEHS